MRNRPSNVRPVHHPIFARLWPRLVARAEALGQRDHRQELLAGLRGRVLEVGAGTGINFKYYPASVTEVIATEPESYLRQHATEAAQSAPIPVRVTAARAERLPFKDQSFDAGIVSLVLCSVQDSRQALGELFRVIRPGGELRFYEHVRATGRVLAGVQRAADAIFWPSVSGGCHCGRDTLAGIEQAGFVIERVRRFRFCVCVLLFHVAPHVLGRARRP
jgi:SAM-dependent methyltransferase